MVRIRLRRTGAKNNPAYRIVVADQKAPRDGAFIDTIGHYLPTRQPHVVEIDGTKARKWLAQGAQPSDTALSLLKQKGIVDTNGKATPEGTEAPAYGTFIGAAPMLPTPVAAAPVVAAPVVAAPVVAAPVVIDPTPEPVVSEVATEAPAMEALATETTTEVADVEVVAETPAATVGEGTEAEGATTTEGASA